MGINDYLIQLIKLRGPCPDICNETIKLGGSGGTETVDIITGLPVTDYPPTEYGDEPTPTECCMTVSGTPFAGGSTLDPLYYEFYNTSSIATNLYPFDFNCTDSSVTIEFTVTSNLPWPPTSGIPLIMQLDLDQFGSLVTYPLTEGVMQSVAITTSGFFYLLFEINPNEDFNVNILVQNVTCGTSQIINVVNIYAP